MDDTTLREEIRRKVAAMTPAEMRREAAGADETGQALLDLWLSGELELTEKQIEGIVPKLPALYYERKRQAIAAKLGGVRVGAVDEIRRPAGNGKQEGQGQRVAFSADAPWPESVDGGQLLDDLATVFSRHVVLPAGAADALALWVAFAHVYDLFDVAPLLAATSPTKRCGKTTLLDVAGELAPRALRTSGISPAALFRSLAKWSPTLIVDEADVVLKDNEALRLLLNAGHTRAAAFVVRCEGEDLEPSLFSTWGCKIVAAIGRLPDTLADRSIEVRLQRKRPEERTTRVDRRARDLLGQLRRQLVRWAQDVAPLLRSIDSGLDTRPEPSQVLAPDGVTVPGEPEVSVADEKRLPAWLGDRARDNWRPLLTIARAVDRIGADTWQGRARAAIEVLERRDADDSDTGTLLLADLRELFTERTAERLRTDDILSWLHDREERPWNEWGRHEKPMTASSLAAHLRRYGVKPVAFREGEKGGIRGYERETLEPVWGRYLPRTPPPPDGGNRLQPATPDGAETTNPTEPDQDIAGIAGNVHSGALRPDVAVASATRNKDPQRAITTEMPGILAPVRPDRAIPSEIDPPDPGMLRVAGGAGDPAEGDLWEGFDEGAAPEPREEKE